MKLDNSSSKKSILFTAPSGAGKSTLITEVMQRFPQFTFSISATTRAPRNTEKDGVNYYFLTVDVFKENIEKENFLEWEEVYKELYYGTLKNEIDRIQSLNQLALFDIDVKGALNIKKQLGENCFAIFISPPTLEILEKRLKLRGTENNEDLKKRLDRASFEMSFSNQFDYCLINDQLDLAKKEVITVVNDFLNKNL